MFAFTLIMCCTCIIIEVHTTNSWFGLNVCFLLKIVRYENWYGLWVAFMSSWRQYVFCDISCDAKLLFWGFYYVISIWVGAWIAVDECKIICFFTNEGHTHMGGEEGQEEGQVQIEWEGIEENGWMNVMPTDECMHRDISNRALPNGHWMSPSRAIFLEVIHYVQPNRCDVTMLNYVSSLIAAMGADDVNICYIIVGTFW